MIDKKAFFRWWDLSVYLIVCLSACVSVCVSVCLSVCTANFLVESAFKLNIFWNCIFSAFQYLFVYHVFSLHLYLSVCLSVRPSICFCTYLTVCLCLLFIRSYALPILNDTFEHFISYFCFFCSLFCHHLIFNDLAAL